MNDWRTFPLRVLKAAWGIAIDLRARAVFSAQVPSGLLTAGNRVLLDVSKVQLPAVDVEQLQTGLQAMAAAIEASVAHGYIVIEVGDVNYTPTDYQPEGLAAAMVGWVCEEFGLESPMKDVRFDRANNKYVFSF